MTSRRWLLTATSVSLMALAVETGALLWYAHRSPVVPVPVAATQDEGSVEVRAAELINSTRAASGVAAVAVVGDLSDLARWRSRDMAARGYFGHWAPDQDPSTDPPVAFVVARGWGVPYLRLGEVLARCPASADDPAGAAVSAWRSSPTHAAVVLEPEYSSVGVGAARDSSGRTYVTGVFGS